MLAMVDIVKKEITKEWKKDQEIIIEKKKDQEAMIKKKENQESTEEIIEEMTVGIGTIVVTEEVYLLAADNKKFKCK